MVGTASIAATVADSIRWRGSCPSCDWDALHDTLQACERDRQPVLLAVAVLGTTEYGTIDPVDGVVDARDRFAARGFDFGVHGDGAWGGYLATLFRNEDGSLRAPDEVGAGFRMFPSTEVHAAFEALARTDSVTVNPHKLGYLPYGSGAFICRIDLYFDYLARRMQALLA